MPVVSNTSPLLNLSIIGHLDLVRAQFGRVLVPPAVLDELQIHSSRPGVDALKAAIDAEWIVVREPSDAALIRTLRRDLDQGEAEAIALAVEVSASLILLDEQEGRKRARALDLPITGAIGVLLKARRAGNLNALRDALNRLQEDAGFWIAPSLRARVLREAE
jgi:predicted nucleic acid-binding protein